MALISEANLISEGMPPITKTISLGVFGINTVSLNFFLKTTEKGNLHILLVHTSLRLKSVRTCQCHPCLR